MVTVKWLKELLNDMLEQIEGYDDDDIIIERANTYGCEIPLIESRTGFFHCYDIKVEPKEE